MKKIFFVFFIVVSLFSLEMVAQAHLPFIEGEVVRRFGEPLPGEDYSFEHPFIIGSNVFAARSIFAYLHTKDVDVYKYTVKPGELAFFGVVPLPPACVQYHNFYPAVALIGPGLPAPDPEADLPFGIPADCAECGIKVAFQTKVKQGERPIFRLPEYNLTWFFPANFEETIIHQTEIPGDYYIVFWDPEGKPGDYTAGIGWGEVPFTPEERGWQQATISIAYDYKILHCPCTPADGPSPF